MRFTHLSNRSAMKYAKAIWDRALRGDRYDENVPKGYFIDCLSESVHHRIHLYLGSKKKAWTHDLACHSTFLIKLQHESRNSNAPRQNDKRNIWRGDSGRRAKNVNNIDSNAISSIRSPGHKALSIQSRSPLTAMPIGHQEQRTPILFTFFTNDVGRQCTIPLFLFCEQPSYTQQLAIPPQFHVMLNNTYEASLLSTLRHLHWYFSNP